MGRGDDDSELWVTIEATDGRWFIVGNGHTFAGRFLVRSPDAAQTISASKDEVTDASDAARWWIEGYLAGSEPALDSFLGLSAEDADALPDDGPELRRWQAALTQFHKTGHLPPND